MFLNGESETARLILRDLVNSTIGFEQLAQLTAKPSKSLHRMLSPHGNPSMDNLAAIFRAVRDRLQVSLEAHSVAARIPDAAQSAFDAYTNRKIKLRLEKKIPSPAANSLRRFGKW